MIDAGAITDIDYSAAGALRDLFAQLKEKRIDVVIGRVSAGLRSDLERHTIVEALGAEKILPTLHQALETIGIDVSAKPDKMTP